MSRIRINTWRGPDDKLNEAREFGRLFNVSRITLDSMGISFNKILVRTMLNHDKTLGVILDFDATPSDILLLYLKLGPDATYSKNGLRLEINK